MTLTDRDAATTSAWTGPLPNGDPAGVPAGCGPGLTDHDGDPWTTAMVDALPRGYKYELLDGVLVVIPSPWREHQRVVRQLVVALDAAVPPGVEVFPDGFRVYLRQHPMERWVEPDLVVARTTDTERDGMRVPPLLVVEVRSPSTGLYDRTAKAAALAEFGLPRLWIVDPDTREVVVRELTGPAGQRALAETARHQLPLPVPPDWPPLLAALAVTSPGSVPTPGPSRGRRP